MQERLYLRHPGKDETVAVATGFSWGALLLGFVWALSKRMWFASFVMFGISTVLFFAGLWGETAGLIGLVLSVVFGVACGAYGNEWHRRTLERRGYTLLQDAGGDRISPGARHS
ncbi:DUF2628 domain-containing protein [Paraburkholderia sp. 22099]|jgi:hypothetical protein|uniref:DUF2628 domain-containing protein n=1 Tax=Paraburkholderia TaxID=1822464 RepID=UPI0028665091|nr:DUF2628 domain-containing protein [Paraburkholderia terricola]MDR6494270.1 hypothetical protein [Paraburkholderia terricola]